MNESYQSRNNENTGGRACAGSTESIESIAGEGRSQAQRRAYPEKMLVIKHCWWCCATIHAFPLGNICRHKSNAIKDHDGCSALKCPGAESYSPFTAAEEPICHPLAAAGLPPCTPYLYTCYAVQVLDDLGSQALSAGWSLRLFLRFSFRKQAQICEWSLIFQARGKRGLYEEKFVAFKKRQLHCPSRNEKEFSQFFSTIVVSNVFSRLVCVEHNEI